MVTVQTGEEKTRSREAFSLWLLIHVQGLNAPAQPKLLGSDAGRLLTTLDPDYGLFFRIPEIFRNFQKYCQLKDSTCWWIPLLVNEPDAELPLPLRNCI